MKAFAAVFLKIYKTSPVKSDQDGIKMLHIKVTMSVPTYFADMVNFSRKI